MAATVRATVRELLDVEHDLRHGVAMEILEVMGSAEEGEAVLCGREAERFSGLHVDDQLELWRAARQGDRQAGRP